MPLLAPTPVNKHYHMYTIPLCCMGHIALTTGLQYQALDCHVGAPIGGMVCVVDNIDSVEYVVGIMVSSKTHATISQ